jgi:hypothetical protein
MRVFCPQHKTAFFTRRRNPIKCENRGHVLGNFAFDGNAETPVETLWQYCCNCEQFCPLELDQSGLATCPACARRISQLYLCNRCFTLSFESSTATQTKNFRFTSEGAPEPSCPGCFQESPGDLHEHHCQKLGALFKTGLSSCPICLEHLDVVVVDAHHEINGLTDDVANTTEFESSERSALFSPSLIEESRRAIEQPHAKVIEKSYLMTCTYCGEPMESRYAFCWSCGHPTNPEAVRLKQAREPIAVSNRIIADDDDPTIHRDLDPIQPAMFLSVLSAPAETSPISSKLKLTATVVLGLLLVMLGGLLVKRLLPQLRRSADAQQVTSNLHAVAAVVPNVEPTKATAETKTQRNPTIDKAEDELRTLRERRIGASPSDRLTILQLFANTEKQFPDDYRFPYERAKLAINGVETRSHDEAFSALSLAAGTAIKTDKADEMLKGLETDRTGDFHKLSHGHREWMQIIEALKRKDASLLASN